MKPTATLYIRTDRTAPYTRLEFNKKNHQPILPDGYGGLFYVRVTEDGKRRWKGFSDFTAAQSEQKRFKANLILADEDLPTLPESKPEAGSIADAVAEFIKYSESREADWRNGADNGLSANSVVAYRKAMQDFSAACTLMGAKLMSEFSGRDSWRGNPA